MRRLVIAFVAIGVPLVVLCAAVALAFRSLARLCWPDAPVTQRAWVAYASGLAVFCAFALLRVGLRLPDALVTTLVVATLWAWCYAMARGLDWRWCVLAGVLSGAAFLSRVNLLHWSLGAVAFFAAVLLTLRQFRASNRTARALDESDTRALASVSTHILPGEGRLRKIAVNGPRLGLSAVRLSGSQVSAEISTSSVLHDPARASAAVRALRERDVVALVVSRGVLLPGDPLKPTAETRTWSVVDLSDAP